MSNKKIIGIIILSMTLIIFCLGGIQRILIPLDNIDCTDAVDGFYDLENNSVDILFIGSSNAFCTINPVVLYEQYGMTAYDFCTSAQPISITTLYLKEALKYQSPSIVCLEVYMVADFDDTEANETIRRWGYNDIKLSLEKINNMYEVVTRNNDDFLSYLFPIIKYKERWQDISQSDFGKGSTYTKGYNSSTHIYDEILNFSEYKNENSEFIVDSTKLIYLDEIRAICENNNIELILFKSPRVDWNISQSEAINEYADFYKLPFLDYMELMNSIGIDPSADFRDPYHLNDAGAEKITLDIGEYIHTNYKIEDRRKGSAWNWDNDIKVKEREIMSDKLNSVCDLTEYVNCLEEIDDLVIMLNIGDGIINNDDDMQIVESLINKQYSEKYNHCIVADEVHYIFNKDKNYLYAEDKKDYFVIEAVNNSYNYYVNGELCQTGNGDIEIIVFDKILNKISISCFKNESLGFRKVQL